jgi:hypothetical protein
MRACRQKFTNSRRFKESIRPSRSNRWLPADAKPVIVLTSVVSDQPNQSSAIPVTLCSQQKSSRFQRMLYAWINREPCDVGPCFGDLLFPTIQINQEQPRWPWRRIRRH